MGKTTQYEKTGGYKQELADFNSLDTKDVSTKSNGTIVGTLPDGRKVNVREYSSYRMPTIEIHNPNGTRIKIRYNG